MPLGARQTRIAPAEAKAELGAERWQVAVVLKLIRRLKPYRLQDDGPPWHNGFPQPRPRASRRRVQQILRPAPKDYYKTTRRHSITKAATKKGVQLALNPLIVSPS